MFDSSTVSLSPNAQHLQDAMDANEWLRQSCLVDLPFTLEQLRILKAIAATGNFTRAADCLHLSQPAISLQVQNLERQLHIPLFDRAKRRVQLTEAGHLLLHYGNRILTLCQETCRALKDLQNPQGGSLIVGASRTPGTYLLPRLLGLFCQQYPQVDVQLSVHATHQVCWSVAQGHVDLAIVEGKVPAEFQDALDVFAYTEDELVLVLPGSHPWAQLETIPSEDLDQLQFVVLDSQSATGQEIDQMDIQGNLNTQRLKIALVLNSIEAIKNAVQSGLGAAFLPMSAIAPELQLGVLQRVPIQGVMIQQDISILFRPDHTLSKAAETFSREILSPYATFEATQVLLKERTTLPTRPLSG